MIAVVRGSRIKSLELLRQNIFDNRLKITLFGCPRILDATTVAGFC